MPHEFGPRRRVRGGGGVELDVAESGDSAGIPLVFVYGYCQPVTIWRKQLESDLARDFRLVAFDLRGHGASEKPTVPEAYNDSKPWADDVAAILEQLDLRRAVLVAWSYAGYVVCDYLRHYGSERLGALALVAAATLKGGERARAFVGPRFAELFPALFSEDPRVLRPAMSRFADLCVADPSVLDEATRAAIVAAGEKVPAVAREAMQRRRLDNDDVLRRLDLPVVCAHGTADAVVLCASSEHNASLIRDARLSVYPGIGHAPFFEASERFNRELRELAARV
jgi:non-heme chloroperoxidase